MYREGHENVEIRGRETAFSVEFQKIDSDKK